MRGIFGGAGLDVDVELAVSTLRDEEEADDGLAIEEDFGISILEVFAAPGVPVVLEGLWGDEAVLGGKGEELFGVLAAQGSQGPVRREFGGCLLYTSPSPRDRG